MNDHTFRRIAVAAMADAADIMDSVDLDDRRNTESALVALCHELTDAAEHGDTDAQDILLEAVPSWFGSPVMRGDNAGCFECGHRTQHRWDCKWNLNGVAPSKQGESA